MTGEEMERAIEFLLNHHAKVSADIEALKEAQAKTTADIQSLTENVSRLEVQMRETRQSIRELRESTGDMRESIGELRVTVASVIEEMREGFSNLIVANEATRNLAEQAAKLAIGASQRVTNLEERLQ